MESSRLPNPDTYLNHIPQQFAAQFEAARNLSLAVLGAFIWDILIYIPLDIKILSRSKFHFVTICFIASRLFALVFVFLAVITLTHPVDHCLAVSYCIGVGCVLTITTTAFIFLQRLRAVYSNNRPVQAIAILLWIGVVITMAFTVVDAQASHIPGTNYCAYTVAGQPLLANGVVFLVFDTFAFVTISYQIGYLHVDFEDGAGLRNATSGKALPKVSRALLRGGQRYYFITLILQIPILIATAIPSIPPNIKLMITLPLGCLASSMACRIFRNMKKIADSEYTMQSGMVISDLNFAPPSRIPRSSDTAFNMFSQEGVGFDSRISCSNKHRKVAIELPQMLSFGPSFPSDDMHAQMKV
ncbi:hypothetical protein NP233_g6584 [Leucocoprinus birnbaumii]|uniref:Uncharacterized protein n=1 Tax=Leucocoprinus birnbaumii TaxID=56174 RepID=A0AAD5VQS3_9AGAR|nr:hypothetical protein NP233_g6584 [Leucocoprinus birnbaumii]